ncbi:MAG: mucoidy inhibitor MuiA family protein [Candidatus Aminicenantes bacterium]|nr:mucoidy inhibitor MuiA family protein [Candidatus Aminicenantes bacterium]
MLDPLSIPGEKAKAIAISSTIESVTVYRDRALVKRAAQHDYQPGDYVLKIANLPLSLLDESVRVSGSGSAAAKILDIKIKSERLEESAIGRIGELEKNQRELENQVRVLDDRMELLNRKDEFLRSLLSDRGGSPDKEQELQKKGIAEWSRMFDFLESNLNKMNNEKRNLEIEKAKLLEKKAVIDHELGQQIEMRVKERKSIEIEVEISRGGSLQVDASYIVPQVSWTPVYDLRFNSDKNEAGLTCQALVRQETGEDWDNTALTLSTARPMMENTLPALGPQTLDRPQSLSMTGSNIIYGKVVLEDGNLVPGVTVSLFFGQYKIKDTVTSENGDFRFIDLAPGTYQLRSELEGFKTSILKKVQLVSGQNIRITVPLQLGTINEAVTVTGQTPMIDTKSSDRSYVFNPNQPAVAGSGGGEKRHSDVIVIKEPLIQTMEVPTAGISAEAVAATFALKQKETILSNNAPQKVTMAVESIPFQREYQAIPKLMEQSFLKATATNSAPFPLLAGKVSIFYDESFVSSTAIPQVSANEKFTVSIGEGSGIKVKRELVEKKTDGAGLFRKKVQTVYEYRITVENFQKSEESITVIDQVPVTENEDIAVELLSAVPATLKPKEEDADKEKREGVLKWLLQLKPLKKKTISFKYSVTYPKKLDVFNLD